MRAMEKTFSLIDSSLTSGVVANIFIAVALGASMKRMWSLLNTLQIITHIPMLGFGLPSNLEICLKTIVSISSMNIIPKAWVNYLLSIIISWTQSIN
jgi:hypothetical protein